MIIAPYPKRLSPFGVLAILLFFFAQPSSAQGIFPDGTILPGPDSARAEVSDSVKTPAPDTAAPEEPGFIWLSGGLGVGSAGVAEGLSLSFQSGRRVVTLRGIAQFVPVGPTVGELGILFLGQGSKVPGSSFATGLAYVTGETVDNFKPFSTVGIPIEVQWFAAPLPFAGIGLYLFGNLNTTESFGGLLLTLKLGKLR